MKLDLFRKEFDEGTKVKLYLFEEYLKKWLPTLIQSNFSETLNIFDFFAGAGKDKDGTQGSPLLTINAVKQFLPLLISKHIKVNLFLNDADQNKVNLLKELIKERMNKDLESVLNVRITCNKFEEIFVSYLPLMKKKKVANFLFLDQHGIATVTKPVFLEIINLDVTDFMFFISSDIFNRFGHVGKTQKHLDISPEKIKETPHNNIHQTVTNHYKSLIPTGLKYYIAPFSIKKPETGNIYGLIFGSGHPAGLQKFINVAWSLDQEFGEANYDIDGENIEKGQGFLFEDMKKVSKAEIFAENLKKAFRKRAIKTDLELLEFALTNGFPAKHVKKLLPELFLEQILPKQKISLSFKGSHWQTPYPIKYD